MRAHACTHTHIIFEYANDDRILSYKVTTE